MTTNTEDERGELEDAFNGTASPEVDPFAFLKLGGSGLPEQQTGAPAAAPAAEVAVRATAEAAIDPEPEVDPEPPADAPKSERLAYFEGVVHRERELFKDTVAAADQRFVERASGPLYAINRESLYLEMRSDATGEPFTRFRDYLQERWGISRAHGYRILNEYPVMTALDDLAPDKLTTRQVPKLLAILRSRGAEDVRTVWEQSEEKTPAGLQATIDRLGWGDPEAEALDDLSESDRERVALVDRWDKVMETLDPAKARQHLSRNPEDAQRLLDRLKPFVDVLEEVAQLPPGKGKK
jgi:hypothetical protein